MHGKFHTYILFAARSFAASQFSIVRVQQNSDLFRPMCAHYARTSADTASKKLIAPFTFPADPLAIQFCNELQSRAKWKNEL